jgi:hypothetical protein
MTQFSRVGLFAVILAVGCAGSESPDSGATSEPSTPSTEAPTGVQQDIEQKALVAPITGTVDGAPFSGLLRVTEFVAESNRIVAVGNITSVTGEISAAAITALQGETYRIPVSFPQQPSSVATSNGVASSRAALLSCDVLFLDLGPLDLDLLGLTVHLNEVVLDIDAATGAGNLLGNLLCAITGLLDPVGFLQNLVQIADLLNQVIGLIGEL